MAEEIETTTDTDRNSARFAGRLTLLTGVLVTTMVLAAYAVVSGDRRFVATGDTFPGLVTGVAEVVGYFIAALSAALVLGGLVYIVTTAQFDQHGLLDAGTFRVHLLAERVSLLWLVTATTMTAIQSAADSGLSVTRMVSTGAFGDALGASEMARSWVAVAICAAVAAVGLRFTVRWVWHAVLVIPALVGTVAVPISGNAGQGPDHDHATSAVIVLSIALAVLIGTKVGAVLSPPVAELRRRVSVIEVSCGAVTLAYGALLLGLLCGTPWLTHTDYGLLGIAAGLLLSATWATDVAGLLQNRTLDTYQRTVPRIVGALMTIIALAAVSAMAIQTAPRLLAHRFTAWDVFLGYELSEPPNVVTLLTFWRFDPFLGVGGLVLAAGYLAGVIRLVRRGDHWPPGRTTSWLFGCLALVFVTGSGVRAYGSAMFSVHMSEHMALNMFIPIFLVLGAPVTLSLRALTPAHDGDPPGPREWVLQLVHSPVTRFISHPVTAFVLFVGSLYTVYFTPLFDTLVRYHWGHELMSIHFLITGYLFFWGIIGIDPGPRRLPFAGRLGMLFAVMPFHAFFGIATMTTTSNIGETFYRNIGLPWLSSLTDDQHLGGAIAWASSELPVIVVVVALVTQWARQDRRAGTRSDRHAEADYADDELDAYNAMLRELARNRR